MESLQNIASAKRSLESDELAQNCNNKVRLEDSEGFELLLGLSMAAQFHECYPTLNNHQSSPKKLKLHNTPPRSPVPEKDSSPETKKLEEEETDQEPMSEEDEEDGEALLSLQSSTSADLEEWEENYERLKEYYQEYGHIEVSPKDDRSLSAWIRHQRKGTTKSKLSEEQIDRLTELGFVWNVRGAKNSWEEKFIKLKQFKERTGHCKVPLKLDRQLNSWVDAQRQANKQGRLSEERIKKLESLGVQWIVKSWESKFKKLVDFKNNHGHCNVPLHSEKQLYRWVVDQRRAHKRGKLSADRVRRLEELGIRLTSKKDMKYKDLDSPKSDT